MCATARKSTLQDLLGNETDRRTARTTFAGEGDVSGSRCLHAVRLLSQSVMRREFITWSRTMSRLVERPRAEAGGSPLGFGGLENVVVAVVELVVREMCVALRHLYVLVPGERLGQLQVAGTSQHGCHEVVPE